MYWIVFAAIALSPAIAVFFGLAFVLVRIDCYGGIRVLGLSIRNGRKQSGALTMGTGSLLGLLR